MPETVEGPGERGHWFARLGHWLPVALVVDTIYVALSWLEIAQPEKWPFPLTLVPLLPVVVIFAGLWHEKLTGTMCILCMEAVPLDPGGRVQAPRKRFFLRYFHRVAGLRPWVLVAAIIGYDLGIGVLLHFAFGVNVNDISWVYAPVDVFIAGLVWALWVHHKYMPWCPWCRRWEDDGPREPSPDPTTSGTKVSS